MLRSRFARLKNYLIGSEYLYERLARSSFWSILGTGTGQVFTLVLSIVIARMLGKTGLGEFGLIRSTIITLGVFAGSGLGLAATKYVPGYRVSSPERAGAVIGLLLNTSLVAGGILTLGTLVWAAPLAAQLMRASHLIGPLQIGVVLITVNGVAGVQRGVLAGLDAFKALTWLAAIEGLLVLSACSVGTLVSGLSGTIAGYALASIGALVLRHAILIKECERSGISVSHRNTWGEARILWSFVVPSVLVAASVVPFEWCASVLLARQPDGLG